MNVVDACSQLGYLENLSEEEQNILLAAAWFHDVGYVYDYRDHEGYSIRTARDFLKGMGLSPLEIKSVCLCIEATRMPQSPSNRIAMILCDADMWHLSSINFFCGLKQLRSEWEVALGIVFTDREWYGVNRDFLHEHTYFTAHAKDVWQQEKKRTSKNLIVWFHTVAKSKYNQIFFMDVINNLDGFRIFK